MRKAGLIALLICGALAWTPAAAQAGDGLIRPDESVRSDLRNIATMMESHLTDAGHYPYSAEVSYNGRRELSIGMYDLTLGFGNRLKAIKLPEETTSGYCIKVERAEGVADVTRNWRLIAGQKGIRLNTGRCPHRFVVTTYPLVK